MDIRTLPRKALDRYLHTVRTPLDTAVRLLPERDGRLSTVRSTVELTLDRADAAVRDVAGVVWRDDQLRDDARRRRLAADERERALRLRTAAEEHTAEADAELRRRQEQAEQRRIEADRRAGEQKQKAEQQRQAEKRQAAERTARQKAAARKAAAKVEAAVDKQAREARLDQLDQEAAALEKEEAALTAANEAQRLRKAAGRTKAARTTTR